MESRLADSMVIQSAPGNGLVRRSTDDIEIPFDRACIDVDIVTVVFNSPEAAPFIAGIETSNDQENWLEFTSADITTVGFSQVSTGTGVAARFMRLTISVVTDELEASVLVIISAVARFSVIG